MDCIYLVMELPSQQFKVRKLLQLDSDQSICPFFSLGNLPFCLIVEECFNYVLRHPVVCKPSGVSCPKLVVERLLVRQVRCQLAKAL
jgi:hypothetical protein